MKESGWWRIGGWISHDCLFSIFSSNTSGHTSLIILMNFVQVCNLPGVLALMFSFQKMQVNKGESLASSFYRTNIPHPS